MKLLAEISEKLNSELTVKDIFSAATVKLQAEKIDIKMGGVTRPAMAPLTHQRGALLTLSYAQQRLWFIDQLNGGSPEYNMPVVFDVVGNLDLDSVEAALNRLIERHEVLRTVYLSQNEGPKQQILDDFDFNLTLHDLSELDENSKQHRLTNILKEDGLLTFKLDSDLMLRACYVLLNYAQDSTEQKGVLMFNVHHIASDGWSIELMSNEFIKLYQSLTMGIVEPLNPLTLQYSDYAAWQRDCLIAK